MTICTRSSSSWRRLLVLASAFLVLSCGKSAWGSEPAWPKEPYKYLVIDQDLREVLAEFGRNIRVPIKISQPVTRRRVRNDFVISSPREFLQRLCDSYGLVWYFDGAVLHVNDESEIRTELIDTRSVSSETLLTKLDALGIADPRFAVRASGDSGVINVSGPPPYLSLVRQTVDALEKSNAPRPVQEVINGDALKVRVFRGGS